jgi:DNA-binding GntR family transcriptional regulator
VTTTRKPHDEGAASVSNRVQVAIRDAIIRGQFEPDQRINVDRVSRDLEVSAIPVREALRSLEVEGWVYFIPKRGAFVSSRTDEEAQEVFEARLMMEPQIALLAASRRTEADLEALHDLVRAGYEASSRDDLTEFLDINTEFHRVMAACTRNSVIIRLYSRILGYVELYYGAAVVQRIAMSAREHEAIYRAVLARDGKGAQKLASGHAGATFETFLPADN